MEYSKDIILDMNTKFEGVKEENGQAKKSLLKSIGKYKIMATIASLCGILIILDLVMIHNFMTLLQSF